MPPAAPNECIFARTTLSFTADLKSTISPCQLGGKPDCTQCGCMASAGLKAVGDHRLMGLFPVRAIYQASDAIWQKNGQTTRPVIFTPDYRRA